MFHTRRKYILTGDEMIGFLAFPLLVSLFLARFSKDTGKNLFFDKEGIGLLSLSLLVAVLVLVGGWIADWLAEKIGW